MGTPPMQIYQFEDELERAVASILLKNGVNDPSKQRDHKINLEDGGVVTLKTPRVEPKFVAGGPGQNEHYYLNSAGRWLDIWAGTLYLKVVTRRDAPEPTHAYLRGLCRYAMQNVAAITNILKYHKIEKMIEQAATSTFEPDKFHDVSSLSFQVWMRIRSEFFPVS